MAIADSRSRVKHPSKRRGNETIESIKSALASKGINSGKAFAVIALDDDGIARVHASGQVKGYLDEQRLSTGFQEAYAKACHRSYGKRQVSPLAIDNDEDSDYSDKSFPTITRAFRQPKGSRVHRPARLRADRGPTMLPSDSSRHQVSGAYLKPEYEAELEHEQETIQAQEAITSEPEQQQALPKQVAHSMRIDETDRVVEFLKSRLKRMQQLAVKKIAKAWIKGICPKKQAKFPYRDKRVEESEGYQQKVPGWWPTLDKCQYKEPDHIRREERMELCLHLLRLRPTTAQLKEWNNEDKSDPQPVRGNHSWTSFLQDLAGEAVFDELQKEDEKRVEAKKGLLREMYEVAHLEEEYFNDERDGNTEFCWWEDEEEKKAVAVKRPIDQAVDFDLERSSRQSSESVDCKRIKRHAGSSHRDQDLAGFVDQPRSHAGPLDQVLQQDVPANRFLGMDTARQNHAPASFVGGNPSVQDVEYGTCMKRDSSDNGTWRAVATSTAFPTSAGAYIVQDPYCSPTSQHLDYTTSGYQYPQQQQQPPHLVQVHQATSMPEPQFQGNPSTPIYGTGELMTFDNYVPQDYSAPVPPSHQFATAMASNQYYPTDSHSPVDAFHSSKAQQFQQMIAERRVVPIPMQMHGLPY